MSSLKMIWDCMFSPRLVKIYGNGPVERLYQPSTLEKWGDQVIHSLYVIWKIGMYTSPILVGLLYQRDYFNASGLISLSRFVTSVGVILVVSYCCRGLSRAQNPVYTRFLTTLQDAQRDLTPTVKQQLSNYDFDFRLWPIEYRAPDNTETRLDIPKPLLYSNSFEYFASIPLRIIAFFAIQTFGIRLVYPGSIGMIQMVLEQSLQQGRSRIIELFRGERFKIQTCDNNEIDTIFIDKRSQSHNGNQLVICSEGNAGFYEIGMTLAPPVDNGYSVLGWNHPGFAGSTGTPFPRQEQNAIDGVIQFAINKLGFRIENITLFSWSIGGYTSSWAAMNYPECKALILDATFDDLLPLALNHMPSWFGPIVRIAIREYVNLNIYEQITRFPGPVFLIRRTQDEVICLRENDLSSNRGNNLLIKLLRYRYPLLVEDQQVQILKDYLAVTSKSQLDLLRKFEIDDNVCHSLLQSYISEYSKSYPMKIGEDYNTRQKNQMALFLAQKYMKDFKSSHCINLPSEMFQMPWDIHVEGDFVFT